MKIIEDSIVFPLPDEELIKKQEELWEVTLPGSYKEFLQTSNGCRVQETFIQVGDEFYSINRFLCTLAEPGDHKFGEFDIDVVLAIIEDRLIEDPELTGVELLPIMKLFADDYICLNFKANEKEPTVCLWLFEESDEFEPFVIPVAENFTEFLELLVEENTES